MKPMSSHGQKIFTSIILTIFWSLTSWGQDTLSLDMQGLLSFSKAHNRTIQLYMAQQKIESLKTEREAQWWLPDLYAGARLRSRKGTDMNTDGTFIPVDKRNLWTGIGIDAAWDFKSKYLVQRQAWNEKALVYKNKAERNLLLLRLVQSYYDLLQAQVALGAFHQLVNQSEKLTQQFKIQVDQGLRNSSEWMLGQSYLQKVKIDALNREEQYRMAMSEIRNLLSLPADVELVIIDKVLKPLNLNTEVKREDIRKKRAEFQQIAMQNEALNAEMKIYTKGRWLPELRVNTNASMFGGTFTPYDPTGILNMSLLWQIPYNQLVKKTDVHLLQTRIYANEGRANIMVDNINRDVAIAEASIELAKKQMSLAEEALMYAQKALDQSTGRQQLGTAQPLEAYQTMQLYIQLRLQYLEIITKYNKAQFALYVALGNEL